VDLRWTGDTRRPAEVRAAVRALVGSFAEERSYVRERDGGLFDVVTGIVDGPFAPHGHTLRLRVS
jgi:hypothetical protein